MRSGIKIMAYESYSRDHFEKKVMIEVAVTGGGHETKGTNVPGQPDEIVEDIVACEKAGASMVHLHARDADGKPTRDIDRFQKIISGIEEHCDEILTNVTTGGAHMFSREERIQVPLELDPKPDLAIVDMGPLNAGANETNPHPRDETEEFTKRLTDAGIKPQLGVFHHGLFTEVENLIEKDILDNPVYCNLILGVQTSTPPSPRNLLNLVENLPKNTEWTCMAIGEHQLPLTTFAMIQGGHVRVGLEDNLYYRDEEPAISNAQLVERSVRIANELNRPVATPDDVKSILNL